MTRMTNYLRDEIVKNALAKTTLDAEEDALRQERYVLAEEFRIASLGGPEEAARIEQLAKKIEKELQTLPKGLCTNDAPFRRDYEMYRLNLGGLRENMRYSASNDDKRISPSDAVFLGDDPLVLKFHELLNRETDLDKRCRDLKAKIRAVLNSCTTVKKLLDVWPEAKELLPEQLEEARPQLPAVQTADLNAAIGLPTGATE